MKQLISPALGAIILGAVVFATPLQAPATATAPTTAAGKTKVNPDALRELLVKGLKATRDDEKQYIDAVVTRVVEQKLALSIVYASFRYARTRRPQYPFPYFVYSVETLQKRKQQKMP